MENKEHTLEEMLGHSSLFTPNELYDKITEHFKALHWTIPGRRNRIYLLNEIVTLRGAVRIRSHKFTPDGELHLDTSHGNIKFFNP